MPAPLQRPKQNGFALVIALAIMALILLLITSLASLTRLESNPANSGSDTVLAERNAILGLQTALGQLQLWTGPDSRITARSDIVGLPSNARYTGVWNSSTGLPLDPAQPLAWLVSGNEDPDSARLIGPDTVFPAPPLRARLVSPQNPGASDAREVVVSTRPIPGQGRYAYWVGDEGVKARIDLDSENPTNDIQRATRDFVGSPRFAIEWLAREEAAPPGSPGTIWTDALYPYPLGRLASLNAVHQIPLNVALENQTSALKASFARFHDLTSNSGSLLVDTRSGGLRQDLTRILDDGVGPQNDESIFPRVGDLKPKLHQRPPTWGRLRDWWGKPVGNTSLVPSLPGPQNQPVSPVIMWGELGLSFFYEDLSPAANPGSGPFRLRFQGFPRLGLWNPYSTTLQGQTYEIAFSSSNNNQNTIRFEKVSDGSFVRLFGFFGYRFSANTGFAGPPVGVGGREWLRFRLEVPDMEPGQALVFSLDSTSDTALFQSNTTTLAPGDFPARYTLFSGNYETNQAPGYRAVIFSSNISNSAQGPSFTGGEFQAYLRAANQSFPGTPGPENIPPNTHQFIDRIGFGQSGLFGISSQISLGNTPELAPQVRFVFRARMGNTHPAHPQRWLANANPIAHLSTRHYTDGDSNPAYTGFFFDNSITQLPSSSSDELSISSDFELPSPDTAIRLIVREPRLPDVGLYQSIAHLQHAPLSDTALGPLNPLGNSLQNPRIRNRTTTYIARTNPELGDPIYDSSYLLNEALWDRYFLSGIEPSEVDFSDLDSYQPANRRLHFIESNLPRQPSDLEDHRQVASHLFTKGGFNLNSTSEQAWRSLLASANGLAYDPVNTAIPANSENRLQSPFSRFHQPRGDSTDPWGGFRQLDEIQIAALASNIVSEIKLRGPFDSIGDFVNRRLSNNPTGLKGTLQAALDATDRSPTLERRINNLPPYDRHAVDQGQIPSGNQLDLDAYRGLVGGVSVLPISSRNAFGPGYLTQADLLSRIGSTLSARSDTFLIRAYGNAADPASGEIVAQAWCEAIVQRLPQYIDPSITPEQAPLPGSLNQKLGRRYSIVSFRWLQENEI
ncbi:MAG: hypothetical protein ACFCU4_07865 [Puniceicoccaceae bacterium]